MILAARHPFKRVMGVEYAPDLVDICRRNLALMGLSERFEITLGDATEFQIPSGPVMAMFNNPFLEPVHRKVLENLRAAGGTVLIAHRGPGHDVVNAFGATEVMRTENAARFYEL